MPLSEEKSAWFAKISVGPGKEESAIEWAQKDRAAPSAAARESHWAIIAMGMRDELAALYCDLHFARAVSHKEKERADNMVNLSVEQSRTIATMEQALRAIADDKDADHDPRRVAREAVATLAQEGEG